MYTDTILFIVGGAGAALAIFFVALLVLSRKKSKMYKTLIKKDVEQTELLSHTLSGTRRTQTGDPARMADAERFPPRTGAPGYEATEFLGSDDGAEHVKHAAYAGAKTEVVFQTGGGATERIMPTVATGAAVTSANLAPVSDFNANVLAGKYAIKGELGGGGMSRVFLAENMQLGNEWIVKFIPNDMGSLDSEENILKLLNHIHLPKIVDIFRDEKGVYIVESYIEGLAMGTVLAENGKIGQSTVIEWGEQISQVLQYLHGISPRPVYHFDLKPSNIMVTHNDRLVLIDFGISRQTADSAGQIAVTYAYAAPEQITGVVPARYRAMTDARFGMLPPERAAWYTDGRTDIYSLGVVLFELATGVSPTRDNMALLRREVSGELAEIIEKCLQLDPARRYQRAEELVAAFGKARGSKAKMLHTLFTRKLLAGVAMLSFVVGGGGLGGGYYAYGQEAASLLEISPQIVTVSLQHSTQLDVEKIKPNGAADVLDASKLIWTTEDSDVAQIDGGRILGMNLGETEITGRYRDKEVSLSVRVVEPLDGMVDISQIYETDGAIKIYAGTQERDWIDGDISSAEFVSPESIAVTRRGTVYLTDSGLLRKIEKGNVETIYDLPGYMSAAKVRTGGDMPYVLTNYWEEDSGVYYGIAAVTDSGCELFYRADAKYTAIEDFFVTDDSTVYFIERNAGIGKVLLKSVRAAASAGVETIAELPDGTTGLAPGDGGLIYLCNSENGTIQVWDGKGIKNLAGVADERAFIDGAAPQFYMPQKMCYDGGYLYVWDFNVLRRLTDTGGKVTDCITAAGIASPEFDERLDTRRQSPHEAVLPNSLLTECAVSGGNILLTNPKQGVIWTIN